MKEGKNKEKAKGNCSTSRFSCAANYIWGLILLIFLIMFIITTIK
jgi:hypothetical protein